MDKQAAGTKRATLSQSSPAPICGALAEVIRQEREARGLSKYELAKRAGISRAMVGLVEAARANPTLDLAARICWAFALPLARLVAAAERLAPAAPGPRPASNIFD